MNRLRLATAYLAIMLAGLLLFAAAAVFAIDRAERSALDARLQTAARAAVQFVDVVHGRMRLDKEDRAQIPQVIGPGTQAAVIDRGGAVVFSTVSGIMPRFATPYASQARFMGGGRAGAKVRAFALPVKPHAKALGTVLVWTGSDWIDETDRNLAIALGALAVVIALLAVLAGNIVTRRALEDAFARQRRFTADASHELRAPLSVIRAEADLALRKERGASEYRSALETVASEADRMEMLIGDLLSAARAEGGALVREPVSTRALLTGVAERLHSAAAAKGARIQVQAEDAVVIADGHSLERALLAIGHNAVKYTGAGGAVTLICAKGDRTVDLVVEDQGPGFSDEALEHALERFWREPGSRAGSGTGLGLAIARAIVSANGGTIAVANAARGGVVRLRFPAA